MAVSKHKQ
jgi:hypothetical protein